jgi:hypothetical protein
VDRTCRQSEQKRFVKAELAISTLRQLFPRADSAGIQSNGDPTQIHRA